MKLHSLEITAMGPYAETVEVDFDQLDEAGVYLLTGPTGSGKTTVLDAVSYALFNRIPKEAKGDEFVSDHREVEVTPLVRLEATIGGDRYRVTRIPGHVGVTKNGKGTKNVGQSLTVERHQAGDWEQLTGKWSEGNELLAGKIGMDANQFSQVVMLPQGEFARFLKSSVNDRKDLLMQLFPGADLAWLERWMKQRYKDDRDARDEKLAEIQGCFQAVKPIAETLVEEGDEALPAIEEPGPALEWIDDRSKILKARRDETAGAQNAAAEKATDANAALDGLKGKSVKITERRKAEAEKAELGAREDWRRSTAAEIEAAEKAAGVHGFVHSAKKLRSAAADARTKMEEASLAIASGELTADLRPDDYAEAAKRFEAAATTIRNFEHEELPQRRSASAKVKELEASLQALADEGPSSELGKARAEARAATEQAKQSKLDLIRIRQTRTEGMAVELAGELKPGEPCVVCGSTEHPAPAQGDGPQVSKEDEERAQSKSDRDQAAENTATKRVDQIQSRINADRATAAVELKAAQRSLAKLEKRESELAAGAATVSDRREALENAAELLTGSITARKTATEAAKAADKAEADADRQAEESGFDSTKAAEDAARDDTTLEALKRDLAVYDQRLALVTKQLDEDLAGIDPDEEIDLGPATEAAQEAGASYKEASEIAGVASDRFETFRRETEAVAGYYEELGPLRDAARTSAELWRMTNGENDRKMNLSIFVLATRLRQVIEAANRHLQSMSDQRYELLYSGDKKGNAMAGLGIEVFDSYTSEARPTTTLSGGESFYASLALALGLAEVVQQESGGNRQETLFIDEGFGTLDPESLDKVMDVIDSLREGGRSVGLVSHVEELKNRIAAKIVVTPGQDGSTLEVTNG